MIADAAPWLATRSPVGLRLELQQGLRDDLGLGFPWLVSLRDSEQLLGLLLTQKTNFVEGGLRRATYR